MEDEQLLVSIAKGKTDDSSLRLLLHVDRAERVKLQMSMDLGLMGQNEDGISTGQAVNFVMSLPSSQQHSRLSSPENFCPKPADIVHDDSLAALSCTASLPQNGANGDPAGTNLAASAFTEDSSIRPNVPLLRSHKDVRTDGI